MTPSSLIPLLVCDDIAATHDFLVAAFGFDAGGVHRSGGARVVHGEVRTASGAIWLHAVTHEHELVSPQEQKMASGGLVVFVDGIDEHFCHTRAAGATIDSEPTDQDYGQREYGARDPEGHRFWFATRTSP